MVKPEIEFDKLDEPVFTVDVTVPPADISIKYDVIADPPVDAGAVQDKFTVWEDVIPTIPLTGPGFVEGITGFDIIDPSDVPIEFTA